MCLKPPGMPVEREINHKIELEPGATPAYQCQYRVSAAELAELRTSWMSTSKRAGFAPVAPHTAHQLSSLERRQVNCA